jgi:hypothetical protein
MSSRSLLNLALLVVAAVLALLIFYQPGITPEPAPQTVTALSSENIRRIQVDRQTRDPLTFTRRHDEWFLGGDRELPASNFQVNSLLAVLQTEMKRSYPVDSVEPETLGLEPPLATLTLDDVRFKIGTIDALDKLRYLQTGNTVFLVSDRYQHLISADWPGFVSRKLLPANAAISQLQLPQTTLSLSTDKQWRQPATSNPVDSGKLQTLIDRWQQARATYIRHYQPVDGSETVTLGFSNAAEPITFQIVTRTPELILARPELGIQYHLQADMAGLLLAIPPE